MGNDNNENLTQLQSCRMPLAELEVENIFVAQLENSWYYTYRKLNENQVYSYVTGKVLNVYKFTMVLFSS